MILKLLRNVIPSYKIIGDPLGYNIDNIIEKL